MSAPTSAQPPLAVPDVSLTRHWPNSQGIASRQAWREKVALCFIALLMGGVVGFATIGLNRALCPATSASNPGQFIRLGEMSGGYRRL
jgi:hypothetical protein